MCEKKISIGEKKQEERFLPQTEVTKKNTKKMLKHCSFMEALLFTFRDKILCFSILFPNQILNVQFIFNSLKV